MGDRTSTDIEKRLKALEEAVYDSRRTRMNTPDEVTYPRDMVESLDLSDKADVSDTATDPHGMAAHEGDVAADPHGMAAHEGDVAADGDPQPPEEHDNSAHAVVYHPTEDYRIFVNTRPSSPEDGDIEIDTSKSPVEQNVYDSGSSSWVGVGSSGDTYTDADANNAVDVIADIVGADIEPNSVTASTVDASGDVNSSGGVLMADFAASTKVIDGEKYTISEDQSVVIADELDFRNGGELELKNNASLAFV